MSAFDRRYFLVALRQQIEDALTLPRLAAAAYRSSVRRCAAWWHVAAERSYELILREIARLTGEESDHVELSIQSNC